MPPIHPEPEKGGVPRRAALRTLGLCAGLAALGTTSAEEPKKPAKPGAGEEYWIDSAECTECDLCTGKCPVRAIKKEEKGYTIDQAKCTRCGHCLKVCEPNCIKIRKKQ